MFTVSTLWHDQDTLKQIKNQLPTAYSSLLIQVFWGKSERDTIPSLQKQLTTLFPHAAIMGTTTAGSIFQGQSVENEVVISFTAFEHIQLKTCFYHKDTGFNSGQKAIETLTEKGKPSLLITFVDQAMNGIHFANAINQFAPDIPLAGGVAGDAPNTLGTCIFDGENIASDSVVVTAFYGEIILHQQFNFNWQPIGKPFTITKAQDNIVYEIEGKPALDFYADYLGQEIVDAFMPQIALEFPLVFKKKSISIARACLKACDDGSMVFAGDIPTGQTVQFGLGSRNQIIQDSIQDSLTLRDQPIESIFIYSCIARKILLGDVIDSELKPLGALAPANGFFTHGEIVHAQEENAVLNQTLTFIALSESPMVMPKAISHTEELKLPETIHEAMLHAMANLSIRLAKELEASNQKHLIMAEHDQLTDLFNRYAGERILETEIERARRHNTPLSLAIIDIDHFKQVNDTYGHLAGDKVLVALADLLESNVRKYDAVIRWGGEEILIILPNTTAKEAISVMEKLRLQFSQMPFDFGKTLTFSVGIAQWRLGLSETTLFKKADEALFYSKQHGRNQTTIAQD